MSFENMIQCATCPLIVVVVLVSCYVGWRFYKMPGFVSGEDAHYQALHEYFDGDNSRKE